ncbi:MAG: cell filamentation protein Fic [Deltaproteobacteria bacterium RIFOXYA12_FULL_58_15]|nr:MAG: cell filamentation protein Fic [Deltaproteobacteria bacterium RIFOXYA12_FULL_58_15]
MVKYVWQHKAWPDFTWDSDTLITPLSRVRFEQGKLCAQAEWLGLEAQTEVLVNEAFATSAIEGEKLNKESIRSSVARRLGLPSAGLSPTERHVDGLVEMLIDATRYYEKQLTRARLWAWQAALFPTGYSGIRQIAVGAWRNTTEPMQVVSGPIGREKVHYEAPPSGAVPKEMTAFLDWWHKSPEDLDGVLRAGVAHFWFVSIHPFEDGNGRLARALTDMALAASDNNASRLYSMSAQIMAERNSYYEHLNDAQKGNGEITAWLCWFCECLHRSMGSAEHEIQAALAKSRFWQKNNMTSVNDRQRKILNRLLDTGQGRFEGGMNNRKYVSLHKVSPATAKRELTDLFEKQLLVRNPGRGRSTSYDIDWEKYVFEK